jgi:hypothetical protein
MEMQKNHIMEAVISGKFQHNGNRAVIFENLAKAVEGYLPMLEPLGEVMDSMWNNAEAWGFLEGETHEVHGMPIPEVHLETMKRVRNAMLKIASPMNQNMFHDYLDYGDLKGSYLEWMAEGFMEYMGAKSFKDELLPIMDEAIMDENVYQFYLNMRPRAEAVWNASGSHSDDYLESWLEECATTGILFDPVALPSVEDTFFQFCEYCSITPSDELKALWMAN